MALGIASTTAVFSATNAVLLRPLPFPSSERALQLNSVHGSDPAVPSLAFPDLTDFRDLVPDFASLTIFARNDVTLQHGSEPQVVHALQVDDSYARVFALRPALGRLIAASDTESQAGGVAVLSYDFWMREFGGDRSLVGSVVNIDNESVLVVGVLSPGSYVFPRDAADLLTPLRIPRNSYLKNRGAIWASGAAMLKPGATIEQAQRDLTAAAASLTRQFPLPNHELTARVKPLREAVVGSVQSMLELLAAAIAAVLLIACVNVANLILGRAQIRSREFAVRSALSGSPSRVRRQVVTESLLLASVGGTLGVLLAPLLTHALITLYPEALPRADEIGISAPVLLVAFVGTVAAGVLAAIPTARRVGHVELADDLRDGGRAGVGRRDRRTGRALVVTQVAASVALLFAAGLLLRTFWRLENVKPGFDARHAIAFHVYTPTARYPTAADAARYYDRALESVRSIPGVRFASSETMLPFGGGFARDVFIQEERGDRGSANPSSLVAQVSPEFEGALGVPLLRGRSFAPSDDSASEHVAMIDQVTARRFYPGQDPIGREITWNGQQHWRIVGVLGSTHVTSLDDELVPVLYVPVAQALRRSRYIVVRSELPAADAIAAARTALHRLDPTIALADVATMDERVQRSLGAERFRAALMATLGALALALAVIGIYGVVAYSVSRRTREIGIRIALGEEPGAVRRRVVGDALRVASVGLLIGVLLALASGRWLSVFLAGASARDVPMLAAATGLLTMVVAGAAYGPARRAARVDPVTALRAE
jgi:putative ABC transport system permease protein